MPTVCGWLQLSLQTLRMSRIKGSVESTMTSWTDEVIVTMDESPKLWIKLMHDFYRNIQKLWCPGRTDKRINRCHREFIYPNHLHFIMISSKQANNNFSLKNILPLNLWTSTEIPWLWWRSEPQGNKEHYKNYYFLTVAQTNTIIMFCIWYITATQKQSYTE